MKGKSVIMTILNLLDIELDGLYSFFADGLKYCFEPFKNRLMQQ